MSEESPSTLSSSFDHIRTTEEQSKKQRSRTPFVNIRRLDDRLYRTIQHLQHPSIALPSSFKDSVSATMIWRFILRYIEIRDKFGRKEHEILTGRSRDIGSICLFARPSVRSSVFSVRVAQRAPSPVLHLRIRHNVVSPFITRHDADE